jgi:hypothetical protein
MTPDTSAVRAWAKDNGYEVADRGRLPADVTGAYLAATGDAGTKASAPAKKKGSTVKASTVKASTVKAAPAKTAATKTAPAKAPAKRAASPATAVQDVVKEQPGQPPVIEQEVVAAAPAPKAAKAAPATQGSPKPRMVSDDRRLVALGEEIAALTKRVEALEQASGGTKSGAKGAARFRRRS